MSLLPDAACVPDIATAPDAQQSTLEAFSVYNLTSVEGLIWYFHATAGLPVRDTWLKAIKAGNFESWPGLAYQHLAKYCPMCKETIKVHMVHTQHHVGSTKPTRKYNNPPAPVPEPAYYEEENDTAVSNELHIKTTHIRNLYTDDTGSFPVTSTTGHQYIMVEYHFDANAIIAVYFKAHKDKERMFAYNSIMQRLKDSNMLVNL